MARGPLEATCPAPVSLDVRNRARVNKETRAHVGDTGRPLLMECFP